MSYDIWRLRVLSAIHQYQETNLLAVTLNLWNEIYPELGVMSDGINSQEMNDLIVNGVKGPIL